MIGDVQQVIEIKMEKKKKNLPFILDTEYVVHIQPFQHYIFPKCRLSSPRKCNSVNEQSSSTEPMS